MSEYSVRMCEGSFCSFIVTRVVRLRVEREPGVAAMEVDEEAHSTTSSGASTASWRRSSSRPIRRSQRYISPNTADARGPRDDAFELVAVWCRSHKAASFVVFASPSGLSLGTGTPLSPPQPSPPWPSPSPPQPSPLRSPPSRRRRRLIRLLLRLILHVILLPILLLLLLLLLVLSSKQDCLLEDHLAFVLDEPHNLLAVVGHAAAPQSHFGTCYEKVGGRPLGRLSEVVFR